MSPLNSQAYLMQKAIKYGKQLKSSRPSLQEFPVVSKRGAGWVKKLRDTFKR